MSRANDPKGWVGEDEMLPADAEGSESARAAVAFGQAKRRDWALQRRGQLERIREVFDLGEGPAYEDVRVRTFYEVIGYVHEQKWLETVEDLRRRLLPDERPQDREWRLEMMQSEDMDADRVHPRTLNVDALFLSDRRAVAGMTRQRDEAIARANEYLETVHPGMVADERHTYPNPYQDLWVIDPIDPDQRDEVICGGSLVVVPAEGKVYEAGDGAQPRPPEVLGMIGPPDTNWD
ncbi:hypothetical protein LL946_04670 [Knoellia locipacati]|uniref:hypothetical protein n=1 Tax=Knoellia locipacati TaxID=882824 RepID=UPI0038502A7A